MLAFNLIAENADINISGSGNAEITANQLLKVKIAGSGNVYYKSNPVINLEVSGSGKVVKK